MKIQHRPHHWIAVALVLAALLLTLTEVHGQATGAAAVFEGRPAMAGAQAGLGAQSGPPQGGIGLQGSDRASRDTVVAANTETNTNTDMTLRREVEPKRDQGLAKEERSAARKAKRAAKRTISRSRHGVAPVDSRAQARR